MRERYHVSERRISTTFAFNRSSLQYAARQSEFRDDARRITSLQLAGRRAETQGMRTSGIFVRDLFVNNCG
jgi:hypothetical protein